MFFFHQIASAGILASSSPGDSSWKMIAHKGMSKIIHKHVCVSDACRVDGSPQRRCKWAGRAIPAAAPSVSPVWTSPGLKTAHHLISNLLAFYANLHIFTTCIKSLTFHSYAIAPIPAAAPEPARPMKWPLPMLLANSEAPTSRKTRELGRSQYFNFQLQDISRQKIYIFSR